MDHAESFRRLSGFPVRLVLGVEPCDNYIAKLGWKAQRTYLRPSGKMRWMHVCYEDECRQQFESWRFLCQSPIHTEQQALQAELSWLVRLIKAIERQEVHQCRQSAIDPKDILAMLKGEQPRFESAVAYEVPDLPSATAMLCELLKEKPMGVTPTNNVNFGDTYKEVAGAIEELDELAITVERLWNEGLRVNAIHEKLTEELGAFSKDLILSTPIVRKFVGEEVAKGTTRDAIAIKAGTSNSKVSALVEKLGLKFEGRQRNSKNLQKKPLAGRMRTNGKNTRTNGKRD